MIITLIALICLIVGIILFVVDDKFVITSYGSLSSFGLFLFAFGIIVLLSCGAMILDMNIDKDIDYQNMLEKRELIEYRLENKDRNFVSDGKLYNDIVEFNDGIRKVKEGANSPWTNWFYNDDIATIDYIEVEE